MAHIRATSNPEGLYIYDTGGITVISTPKKAISLPSLDFIAFVKAFDDNFWETFVWDYISIQEEVINDDFKMVLRVHDIEFPMWFVTWAYVVQNVLRNMVD